LIYVFDVDGTICFNGKNINSKLIKKIKMLEENNEILFASARPIRDLIPVVKSFENNTLIGGNGSIISKNKSIKVIKQIPIKDYKLIKQIIRDYNLKFIIDDSFNYSSNVDSNNTIFKQLDPDNLAENISSEKIINPIKIILVDISNEIFSKIKQYLITNGNNLSICFHEKENNIDITSKSINKHFTLRNIIGEKPYIAFGNDINDFELLKYAEQAFYVNDNAETKVPKNFKIISASVEAILKTLECKIN
jgi:HAD superfamily hydrolase (TIGR01484 family)